MSLFDTFLQLPLRINKGQVLSDQEDLKEELSSFNNLVKAIATNQCPEDIPSPPGDVHPKRSIHINRLKESGIECYRKKNYEDAVKLYTLAIEMASGRPHWEPVALSRDELATAFYQRSIAYIASKQWGKAFVDASTVVGIRKAWSKGHLCKSKVFQGMGMLDKAKESLELGLSFEPRNDELLTALKELNKQLGKHF
ncbi:uncharacterized protein T551_03207 [Pneumocystis jirovecii RU7]|uniref:Translocation protein SEC72 n=1 Tax=Pneumocystis jirovecii (strain RU7) TaxID=1408657 RepID=A0A0W4ZFP9_PNEJ7|nr:uncharacterized protein T551_03207 [Pneumocystis jirovecii RU7]KTW27213.1 hypothetical protein T551_03207 [Pneumocystis jirovecii RU7]